MPAYSHSQLSTYESCPQQYKFVYVDKVKTDIEGIEAFMGSRVHEGLEKLYRDLKVTRLNTLEEILAFYHQSWDKHWNEMVQIVRKDYTAEEYRRLGEKCLTDYYRRYFPFNQGRTLGLEESIFFALEEEKGYWIRGFIDRLALVEDSILEIHDYKTSNRLPKQRDIDSDRQLSFYQMGVDGKWQGIREVRLIWHYLAFDAEIRASRSREELSRIRRETLELIHKIEGDRAFTPKEGPLCDWCDYQTLCPKRKHLITVGQLPPNEFLNEEGVTLVNRYVELIEKKRTLNEEMDSEIAKLEEAIYEYGRREGIEAICGSNHTAKIKLESKEKYPLKGDPQRRLLDEMIKNSGKWMEVSDLNPWMLARIVSRGSWPPSLIKKVKEFSMREESRSISITKLKERE